VWESLRLRFFEQEVSLRVIEHAFLSTGTQLGTQLTCVVLNRMSAWADAGATFTNGPGTICALHVPAIESASMDNTACTAVLTIAWPKLMAKADLDR
jgi:hypothetical protein